MCDENFKTRHFVLMATDGICLYLQTITEV